MSETSGKEKIAVNVYQTKKGYKATREYLPNTLVGGDIPTNKKDNITLGKLPRELHQGYNWAPWGTRDMLPTKIRRTFANVGIAGRVQNDLAKTMFGNGLVYYKRSDFKRGKEEQLEPAEVSVVENFLEDNLIESEWLFPQFLDYRYNFNSFSEMILNRRNDAIVGLYHKEAEFCRLGVQNEANLKIEHLYYSPDFSMGFAPSRDRRVKIELLTWFDAFSHLRKQKNVKFAYHTRIKTPVRPRASRTRSA